MSQFYDLKVVQKKELTPESVSVVLEIPENLKEKFKFHPGQFVMLEKNIKGALLRRYYSIYNAPGGHQIKLGIKDKGGDGFADYAKQHLKVGEYLRVSVPMDDVPFDLNHNNNQPKKFLAITIGSGITPFYSYIQYLIQQQSPNKLVLIYGNETPEKTMFYKSLKTMEQQHPQNLKVYYVFSKNNSGDFMGRINPEIIKTILKKEGADFDGVYIIGPDDLKKTAAQVLVDSGIPTDRLHYRVYS